MATTCAVWVWLKWIKYSRCAPWLAQFFIPSVYFHHPFSYSCSAFHFFFYHPPSLLSLSLSFTQSNFSTHWLYIMVVPMMFLVCVLQPDRFSCLFSHHQKQLFPFITKCLISLLLCTTSLVSVSSFVSFVLRFFVCAWSLYTSALKLLQLTDNNFIFLWFAHSIAIELFNLNFVRPF